MDRTYLPQKIIDKLKEKFNDMMFLCLGGSHLTKTDDDKSDRDFILVTKRKRDIGYCQLFFAIKGVPVRTTVFIQGIEDFYNKEMNHYYTPLALHICNANREEFTYENPRYSEEITQLLNNKDKVSLEASRLALIQQKHLIYELNDNYFYSKWHYHLYFAYGIAVGQPIDNKLLREMKRGENPEKCKEYLHKIKSWLEENT